MKVPEPVILFYLNLEMSGSSLNIATSYAPKALSDGFVFMMSE